MRDIYSLGQVARLLGVPAHRITYAHSRGKADEPDRVLGKRAYTRGEVEALAKTFNVELPSWKGRARP